MRATHDGLLGVLNTQIHISAPSVLKFKRIKYCIFKRVLVCYWVFLAWVLVVGFFWGGGGGACRKVRTFARHFILVHLSLYLSYFLCLLEVMVNEDVQRSKC